MSQVRFKGYQLNSNLELEWIVFEVCGTSFMNIKENEWSEGKMNVNKTKLLSASFKELKDIKKEENDYRFIHNEKSYRIGNEVVNLVEHAVAEYYLLINPIKSESKQIRNKGV